MADARRSRTKKATQPAAVLTDEQGVVTTWSPEAEQLTGLSAAEMVGQPAWEICSRLAPPGHDPDEIRSRVKAMVEAIFTSGRIPNHPPHTHFRFRRRDGEVRTLEHDVALVPTEGGFGLAAFARDSTDDGAVEEVRPEAENMHRLLFEQMSSAVAIHEVTLSEWGTVVDYRFIDVNPAYSELTGLPADRLIGKRAHEVFPALGPEFVEELSAVATSGVAAEFERHDDYLDRDLHIRLSAVGPRWVMAIIEDVTAARRAEGAIRERTTFIETIIASSGEGIITYDGDLRVVVWNPVMEDLTGIPAAQVLGKEAVDAFPEVMAAGVGDELKKALAGEVTTSLEFEYVIPETGRRGWVIQTNRPHLNAEGEIVGVVSSVHDMTARHEIRELARRSEEQFRTIFDSVGDGVAIHDPGGNFVEANRVICERLGYSRDEFLKMKVAAINAPEWIPAIPERVAEIMTQGQAIFETVHVAKDGRRIPTEILSRRIEYLGAPAVLSVHRDISERKKAEEALRQSEIQFRSIFDGVGDGVAIYDATGRFIEVNKMLCERLGYSRDELLTMSVADIDSPESAALLQGRLAAIMSDGLALFEVNHLRRDGTRIPVEVVSRRIEYGGRPAILTVQRDISERRDAEGAHRKQTRFLQGMLDAIRIPIIAKDRDGRILMCNAAFASAGGVSVDEAVGKTVGELGMAEIEMHIARDKALLADGSLQIYESFMPTDRGLRRHLISKAPLRGESGEITGIVTVAVDIHDRYEAEQLQKQSEERFRTLFEYAGDAIFISDTSGRFIDANKTASSRLGYTKEELTGMSVARISPPEFGPAIAERLGTLEERGSRAFETTHIKKDGTAVPVEMIATMIELGGQPAVLGIARDISDRLTAETERATLEDQLRQAQKMEEIGRLAGGIAHDFNNLLTAIRGSASLALASLPPGEGPREDMEQIEQAADRAAGLTRQLLAFARRTVLQPEIVDLGEIVARLEPMLCRLIGEDVALTTIVPEEACHVLADPGQLEQVIVNLCVNARDAMPDGGKLTIEVAGIERAGEIPPLTRISVADTGSGMSAETLDHIFEPFFTTKGPGKGTGLGLSTAYGIVRQSGGTVTASSELGRGSTLTVFLPRVDVAAPVAPEGPHRTATAGKKTGSILVVEDDNGVRRFASRVLEAAGYVVRTASDGATAIEAAAQGPVQVLLTDVVMPGMSGREVALKLAAAQPGIRVLYMSGHTDKGIVRDGVLEPDIDFLAKPFTSEALLAAVDKAMSEASSS